MRKFTAAQSESVASGSGLFDIDVWRGCVAHLHALLTDDDPASDLDNWSHAMQLVKTFVEWVLAKARVRFGALGHECLLHASTKNMLPELEHQQCEAPCVFSGRTNPVLYRTPSHPEPCASSIRLQRRFSWWAHHEQTGLESPHTSAAFVYESHYSYVISGVYALGHLGAILKHKSRALAPDPCSLAEFQALPLWSELYLKINAILCVVHAFVAL